MFKDLWALLWNISRSWPCLTSYNTTTLVQTAVISPPAPYSLSWAQVTLLKWSRSSHSPSKKNKSQCSYDGLWGTARWGSLRLLWPHLPLTHPTSLHSSHTGPHCSRWPFLLWRLCTCSCLCLDHSFSRWPSGSLCNLLRAFSNPSSVRPPNPAPVLRTYTLLLPFPTLHFSIVLITIWHVIKIGCFLSFLTCLSFPTRCKPYKAYILYLFCS